MNEDDIRRMIKEELERHEADRRAREPEVLDALAAAEFLGVDRNTVYEYANRGILPHRRLGRRHLFSRAALVLWLGRCKPASSRKG